MFTFLFIFTSITFILLVVAAAMHPVRSTMSRFELERRAHDGDKGASVTLRREKLLGDVLSLLRIKVALLLVTLVLLSVATFGWVIGIIVALIVALEYGALSRLSLINAQANKLYLRLEPHMLDLVEKLSGAFVFLRSVSYQPNDPVRIDSRQELQHLIAESGAVLNADERRLIMNGLSFPDQLVNSDRYNQT
jgi:CBS domain containing-hemolysin-like protein